MDDIERGEDRSEEGHPVRLRGLGHVVVATVLAASALALTVVAYPDPTPGHFAALVLGGGLLMLAAFGGTVAATTESRRSVSGPPDLGGGSDSGEADGERVAGSATEEVP